MACADSDPCGDCPVCVPRLCARQDAMPVWVTEIKTPDGCYRITATPWAPGVVHDPAVTVHIEEADTLTGRPASLGRVESRQTKAFIWATPDELRKLARSLTAAADHAEEAFVFGAGLSSGQEKA